MMPKTGPVQIEQKKGKWQKRFLTMENNVISQSKSEKVLPLSPPSLFLVVLTAFNRQGKDSNLLCQLSSFDVFFVSPKTADSLKAPKPFVFALKSRLTRAQFIEESEWCHYLSTKTADEATNWVKSILEAGVRFFLDFLLLSCIDAFLS
jgi:hypothetical protein